MSRKRTNARGGIASSSSSKRFATDVNDHPHYADAAAKVQVWLNRYEREIQPAQLDQQTNTATPATPMNINPEPKRKVTCELPWPTLPDRAQNSKFGLGLDRYGHEAPGVLMEEFQDTVQEMQSELAFLKKHPEIAQRIPHAVRLLEKECFKLDNCIDPEFLEVDINKPINIVRKILIPTNRYPTFNFIGKIIGNRGSVLANLGKAFKCHITLCGEGSSRDRKKECHLFSTNEERYLHYGLPLYIQISTIARPHVAFMRVAGFLNVLHKLLIPSHDICVQGITDSNTWYELNQSFVYDPIIFDEAGDEEKEAELRSNAAENAIQILIRDNRSGSGTSSYRGGGNAGASYRDRGNAVVSSPSMVHEADSVVCSDPEFSNHVNQGTGPSASSGSRNGISSRGGPAAAPITSTPIAGRNMVEIPPDVSEILRSTSFDLLMEIIKGLSMDQSVLMAKQLLEKFQMEDVKNKKTNAR